MSQFYKYPAVIVTSTEASVGPTGQPIPLDATLIGGENPSGDLTPIQTDASGNLNVVVDPSSGLATAANQVLEIAALNNIDTSTAAIDVSTASIDANVLAFKDKTASSFVSEPYDYLDITYVGATTDINTVVYKLGGSGGTVVATLTMGYDGSNRLTSVTRS